MRISVQNFVALGRLPAETAGSSEIAEHERALEAIEPPLADGEAKALLSCFGPDDCFGLAWSLVHLIETSPTPFPASCPASCANKWEILLYRRYLASVG